MKMLPVIFRRTPYNKFSLPILAGALESSHSLRLFLLDSIRHLGDFNRLFPRAILCYSFMTPQLGSVMREIRLIRTLYGSSFILLAGGPHPTGDPEGCLNLGFDAVFVGAAEKALPLYISQFQENENILAEKRIIEEQEPSLEIDRYLPYSRSLGIGAPMELSRGCFYNCAFCQTRRIFKTMVVHRGMSSIIEGVRLSIKSGRENIYFISPNALSYGAEKPGCVNFRKIEELCLSVKECGIRYMNFGYFPSEVRPDYVTEESLDIIKRYCANRKIALGIQTGSESCMKGLRRGHTVSRGLEAVRLVHESGLIAHCDFILGFPGETEQQMKDSLDLMVELVRKYGARIHAHYYIPLPGTPFWNKEGVPLSQRTREMLRKMESWGQLDGWWADQEKLSLRILEWKKKGYISTCASA